MRFFARIIVRIIANGVGLYAASQLIAGFELEIANFKSFVVVALTLTILNLVVKPVLKLLLGPIIVLTLGLGLIVVNALVLVLLDFLASDLTIVTIPALVFASLLIGALNFIFHFAQKD
jgi:putative membrane protein